MRRHLLGAVAGFLLAGLAPATALEVGRPSGETAREPILFTADEVSYSTDLGIVSARGHVEAAQAGRVLRADLVTYNERTGVVAASGNVVLVEPGGETVFAEYIELRDAFRNGVLTGLRVLFRDDSRFAANSAVRVDGNRTVLERGVYTGCDVCADDPTAEPIWQIRAEQIVHDQQKRRIEYRDATFEVFGTPVMYLPYWAHADPTVKREPGLLLPDIGISSRLGANAILPLYVPLAPNIDLTLAPFVTSKEGVVMTAEYRHRTANGRFEFDGSITGNGANARLNDSDLRGHIRGVGRFRVDDTWHWGFDVFRASDDTYLRFYKFSALDTLTSNVFVEGIKGRNLAAASAYSFQGLLPSDRNGLAPVVLPLLEHVWTGEVNDWGGYFQTDSNLLSIFRTTGVDTRRLSSIVSYVNPLITDGGHAFTFTAQLRGDGYWIEEGTEPGGTGRASSNDNLAHRVKPLVAVEWHYPLVAPIGTAQGVIEPIASAVLTPYGGNPGDIVNEDSRNFEFDDTNLFAINRFPGRDRYEGGPRINYGIRGAVHGLSGGFSEVLVGQSWRIDPDDSIPADTGLDKEWSDYVGRIVVAPSPRLDFTHRFRLDRDTLDYRRAEFSVGFGPPWARFRVGYVNLRREDPTVAFGNREEVTASTVTQITKNISLYSGVRYDIEHERLVSGIVGLRYIDECIAIGVELDRTNITDRDIRPSTSFHVRIKLRNLG